MMFNRKSVAVHVFATALLTTWFASTTEAQGTKKAPANQVRPQFLPPEVDENLPNVLLIGDSISIGYMLDARKQLAGEANVWRPATNCGPTTTGLKSVDAWIGDKKWDVIHFNFGLHDLKYMGPKGQNLADPAAETSAPQVSIEDYDKNLRKIAERLKATGATVIWRETTPVPEGARGRVKGDSKRYNEVAAKVMADIGGIEIDPMYEVAVANANLQKKADVHYSPEGSAKLGEQVAKTVRAALAARSK
ncbi:MAG: SGNH/GDSL hydrolase family protein [Rubripirellula sp.]